MKSPAKQKVSQSPKSRVTGHQRNEDDPEQSKRFLEAAKEAGADETEESADQAFKKAAKSKK